MQAITLRREYRHGGAAESAGPNDELTARLRPFVDMFTDEELDRMAEGEGPLVFWLLDADGLPTSGVICDRETGRHTRFRLPISGKAVA